MHRIGEVNFRDLTSLESLSLDRNFITKISNDDLNPLGQSTLLSSFSLVSNKIAEIDSRAFEHLHGLTILSIQNNELTTLEGGEKGNSLESASIF